MKKIIFLLSVVMLVVSCSDDFLERYPKGRWHHANYSSDDSLDISILVESKLGQSYAVLRSFWFT